MKQLERELIKRLLATVGICLLAEGILLIPVRELLLPAAAGAAAYESSAATLGGMDILRILRSLFFGGGQREVLGIFARSGAFFLLLMSGILLMIPLAAGTIVFVRLAAARFEELQKLRDAERLEYEQKRNLMFSDFAHDLRTPIMTIAGYARALSDHMVEDPAMQEEYLDAIRRKSERMSELINLLFDYAKLGSLDYRLTLKRCDINALAAEAAAAVYTDAEEAGMELTAEIPETPFMVMADKTQAGRILNNFLMNAIRHNPEGTRIAVLARRLAGVEYIAVADTGVPIQGDAEKLFDPFVKEDSSRSGDKGSGLGLSISRKAAELHGWKVSLEQPYEDYTKAFVICVPEDCGDSDRNE